MGRSRIRGTPSRLIAATFPGTNIAVRNRIVVPELPMNKIRSLRGWESERAVRALRDRRRHWPGWAQSVAMTKPKRAQVLAPSLPCLRSAATPSRRVHPLPGPESAANTSARFVMLLLPGTLIWRTAASPAASPPVCPDMSAATHSYVTRIRNSPCGGAVGPASRRSSAFSTSSTRPSAMWPRPTSISVPAIDRTMLYRKPLASTSIHR